MNSEPLLRVGGLCIDAPGGRPLFRELNLSIGREQVAIVGRNGVGKSSLLEVLAGREEAARGAVRCSGRRRLVRQQLAGGRRERVAESPGERRRRALQLGLGARPDLLLLDEPTQDLDAESIAWLLDRLREWEQGLIVVSHERRVLRLFEHFFVAAESGCRYFRGSFDELMRDLDAESSAAQESYVRNLQQLSTQEEHNVAVANRRRRKKNLGRVRELKRGTPRIGLNSKRGYAQSSQGKRSVLQKARIDAAREWAKATRRALSVELPLEVLLPSLPVEEGPPIVRLDGVSAGFGDRTLFEGLDLELSARDRVAIIGPNGAGKTTLLEIMGREREPTCGRVVAKSLRMGRIAQNADDWRTDESLLYRLSVGSEATGPEAVAQLLLAHRFPLALAERPMASLSPGERVRAALICLFQRRPVVELLVLDEPTDHLDFVGMTALQAALRTWDGGLCVVSHDEEFLQAIGVHRRVALGGTVPSVSLCRPWHDDLDAIAGTMARALRGKFEGWETIGRRDIAIEGHSGFGGGKAYQLSNRANPAAPEAALHTLHEFFGPQEPICFDRQRKAHELFTEAGLTPERICEGPERQWFVERWAGNDATREDVSIELVEEVGRLLARVHAIDTTWYDEVRDRQGERYPALRDAPHGSHIWWYAAKPHQTFDQFSEELQRLWIEAGPVPVTPSGSRLVTMHGDIHRGNLVRTADGLQLIDLEAACVTYAVHDISYCFGALCEEKAEFKQALTRAYLAASGQPSTPEAVHALRLDAERCKMATNFFDTNALWEIVAQKNCENLGTTYPMLVAIADRSLIDSDLADEIVDRGFEGCEAVKEVQRNGDKPLLGARVRVHVETPDPVGRSEMVINWDGTIQSTRERHRAAVLAVDERGEIVLANCSNTNERLQLRMGAGRPPITGLRAPSSSSVPLHLVGSQAGRALVLSEIVHQHLGNDVEFATVGPREKALAVHIESDGVIRLASRPQQAFDCERGDTSPGRKVLIFHSYCGDSQKFSVNDDATVSPVGNGDVVWGLHDGDLILVRKNDPQAQRLTFGEEFARASRVDGPGSLVEEEPAPCAEGYVLQLESHPGMALSVAPCEERNDVRNLVIVPVADAVRFIIAEDHLSLVNGGGTIAIGTPAPAK